MKPKRLAAADYFTSSPISRYEFSKPFEPSNNKISRRIEAILRCTAIKLPKKCGIKTTQARSHKSSQTPKASVLKVVVSKKHYRKSIKFEPNFSNLTQICRRAATLKHRDYTSDLLGFYSSFMKMTVFGFLRFISCE